MLALVIVDLDHVNILLEKLISQQTLLLEHCEDIVRALKDRVVRLPVPNYIEKIMVRFLHPFDDFKDLLIFLAFSFIVLHVLLVQLLTHD